MNVSSSLVTPTTKGVVYVHDDDDDVNNNNTNTDWVSNQTTTTTTTTNANKEEEKTTKTKKKSKFTSDTHPIVVDFIPEEFMINSASPSTSDNVMMIETGIGKLGMCMLPGRKKKNWERNLEKDLQRIVQVYDAQVLVTLVKQVELEKSQIPEFFATVQKRCLESYHFPIQDKFIPLGSMEGLMDLVQFIIRKLKEGKNVVVHCNGGKGRAATVCVCVLLALGVVSNAEEAIAVVRKTRPGGTLRNPLQLAYVRLFKRAWCRRAAL
eukprot:GEZU01024559.1.p1 GENE.GEZU01024559.1~~GEZU01024559.1.p1  ORF type:complete len:266 (-),score=67.44 GEZU01024559.1:37-834(-)